LVYHYYRSKEELFTNLVDTAIEKMNTAVVNLEKLPLLAKEKIILAIDSLFSWWNVTVWIATGTSPACDKICKRLRYECSCIRLPAGAGEFFPVALEDALQAYEYLLSRGYDPTNIVFAGDSAGGGLCLATLLAIKD
jgi:AcrR family transcriptional regulator